MRAILYRSMRSWPSEILRSDLWWLGMTHGSFVSIVQPHLAAVRRDGEKLGDRFLEHGMLHRGRDLGERHKHKSALRYSRVWNSELGCADDARAEQQYVHVDRARSAWNSSLPAERVLDSKQRMQQLPRHQICFGFDHAIQKPPLVAHVHRLSLIKRRLPHHADAVRRQRLDRPHNVLNTISHVRP